MKIGNLNVGRLAILLALVCAGLCGTVCARQMIPRAKTTYELGKEFDAAEAWKQGGADFVAAHRQNYFRFLDGAKKDSANAIHEGRVTYHGLEVYETRIWFAGGDAPGVTRIELSLYNKGDAAEPLNAAELGALLKTVRGTLCAEGAKSPQPESKNMGDGALQKTQTWKTRTPAAAQLTWRYKKTGREIEVDFVRLTLVNATADGAAGKTLTAKKESQSRGSVRRNVVRVTADGEGREKAGDVYISNVPMVDQGNKGYCAVATSERVLRYYGLAVDEHELGASAGSTAEGGTSVDAMYETVRRLGTRYRLGTYPVVGDLNRKNGERAEKFLKEIEVYNKMAKKLKKDTIEKSVYMRGLTVDANAAKEAMEPEVIKAVRMKDGSKFRTFSKGIHSQVDAGVPLLWSVTLGIFPEPDIPQASGGHMRLIIGYNDKTKEIIYTDSWGAAHAYKRMPLDNAWVITSALFYLRPTRE